MPNRTRLSGLSLAAVAVVFAATLHSQQSGTSTGQLQPGSISGRVVADETNRPIAGALVRVTVLPLEGGGAPPPFTTKTDESGNFVLEHVTPGRINLMASAVGFIDATYRPVQASRVPALGSGQRLAGIVLRLQRGGVLSGVIRDAAGNPMTNMRVEIYRRGILTTRRAWMADPRLTYTTDSEGRYRATALWPGEYVVAVRVLATSIPDGVVAAVRAADRPGATGSPVIQSITDSRGPLPGTEFQIAGASGVMMTTGLVSRPMPLPAPDNGPRIYRTTYYPSAATLDAAGVIALAAGERREDVDLGLLTSRPYAVSGTLTRAGKPLPYTGVHLIATHAAERNSDYDGVQALTVTDVNGRFSFRHVPPGEYQAKVVIMPVPSGQGSPLMPADGRLKGWASEPVRVVDRDVTLPPIQVRDPLTISGRFVFEGVGAPVPPSTTTSVWLATLDGGIHGLPTRPRVAPQGEFVLSGAAAGRYHLWGGTFAGWTVKKVTAAGTDITLAPLLLTDRDVRDVEIVLTSQPLLANGVVVGPGGYAADAEVVVFPAPHDRWIADGMSMRGFRRVRTGRTGQFSIGGLPPGNYLAAAVRSEELEDWPDRRIFEALAAHAQLFAITEGRPIEIRLPLISTR